MKFQYRNERHPDVRCRTELRRRAASAHFISKRGASARVPLQSADLQTKLQPAAGQQQFQCRDLHVDLHLDGDHLLVHQHAR